MVIKVSNFSFKNTNVSSDLSANNELLIIEKNIEIRDSKVITSKIIKILEIIKYKINYLLR